MRVFHRFVLVMAAGAASMLSTPPRVAFAQDPATPEQAKPPKLTHFVEAPYPEQALADKAGGAEVELEIDVDDTGAVKDVRVVKPAGHGFDEAALQAARSFQFEPASRGGRPMAARIRYRYVFAPPPEPEPAAPAVVPGIVSGKVLDRADGTPIAGAEVVLTTADGNAQRVVTGPTGEFKFEDVAPGAAHVTISADGHDIASNDEQVEPGTATEVVYRLDRLKNETEFGATARVEAPPREVTKRTISQQEITQMPGTRGDALRAVEIFPGVNRPTPGSGQPIIRGSTTSDSEVFMEGTSVPILYHFGSLTSFVSSRILESVEFYPGNFSARYGRRTGGIIDVRVRDPKTDGLHGVVDLSVLDSSALVETPLGDKFSVLVAARRSNLDFFLKPLVENTDLSITASPVYYDYQGIFVYKPTERDRIRLMLYGSSDRFAVLAKNTEDDDPTLVGAFDASLAFHRAQLGWRHRFSAVAEQNTEFAYGRTYQDLVLGKFARMDFTFDDFYGRSEWSFLLAQPVRLIAGVDFRATIMTGSYVGPPPMSDEGNLDQRPGTYDIVEVHEPGSITAWRPAGYVEAPIRPTKSLLFVPGVRFDHNSQIRKNSVDPRLSARWEVTDSTALKGGVGRYSQAPEEYMALHSLGNPNLRYTHALHTSAGVEQKLGEATTVTAEGFYKFMDGVTRTTPGGREPHFDNHQDGRAYGLELSARVRPDESFLGGRFFGFVSYTLMRSERRSMGEEWRLFDRDQTHILNAAASYALGRGWTLGATLRFSSGVPYTPVIGNSYDANTDLYRARYGAFASARNPNFYRLDVRVEKKWVFSKWNLATYLDVQNALNAPNRDGFSYNYDFTKRAGERGLPIIPSLGLRGEF